MLNAIFMATIVAMMACYFSRMVKIAIHRDPRLARAILAPLAVATAYGLYKLVDVLVAI